ncbi:MAG: hypothetical protein QOE92_96 [Chloroflexota bacterium]|nr:hypothetical protein [Chloroflexota bacterium]
MAASEIPPGEHGQPARSDASSRLQVLSTEHWSLLATRQLTYTESFSRVSMFLAVLSGAVIALALLAQVDGFHEAFTIAAVLILAVVLFVGFATVGRLSTLNREDARWLVGMNRIRRAYLEMHPELEPYFLTGSHDDRAGLMKTLGMDGPAPGAPGIRDLLHGFQTLPAMVGTVNSVVAGTWAALIAAALGAAIVVAVAIGVGAGLLTSTALWLLTRRSFVRFVAELRPAFPSAPMEPPKS